MDFSTEGRKCFPIEELTHCADVLQIPPDQLVVVDFDEECDPIWAREINPQSAREDLFIVRLSTIVSHAERKYPGVPMKELYWVILTESKENGSCIGGWDVLTGTETARQSAYLH